MRTHISPEGTAAPSPYELARTGAVSGGRALVVRYGIVGVLSLAGTTALIRLIGTADWAVAAQGYFLVVFLDQALGANLLGGLLRSPGELGERRLEAAARLALLAAGAIFAVCAVLAVPAALLFGRWEWGLCLVAVGVGGAVFALRSVPIAILERDLEYRTVAVAEILDQVTFYVLAVPAAILGAGLPGVLVALALRSVPAAVLVHRRRRASLRGRPHRDEIRDLLDFARPSGGSAVVGLLDGLVPLAVLGAAHARELGFFLTTSTIAGYAATLQIVAQRIGFASLARLQDDLERFRFAVGRAIKVSTVVVVGAILPLAGLGSLWLPRLLGPDWTHATWVLALLGAMLLLQSPVNLATAMLYAQNRPRAVLVLRIAQTASYAAAAVGLAASDPLVGVPVGAVIGRGVAALVAVWLVRELLPARALGWLLGIPAAAGAVTLGITALSTHRPALAVLAVAVAVGGWALLNRATVMTLWRSLTVTAAGSPVSDRR